ncbi:MAG: DNA-binding protein Alba [Promethearchaeota archaeon]|nr:MAG: DNA-binding protein Alba [Candidatus Lokiarchaeota archaeon]
MNYVMACFTVIQSGMKEIIIKARGRAISRAVDVAEIIKRRFIESKLDIVDIAIGTETIESKDRGPFSVSTIEITLKVNQ